MNATTGRSSVTWSSRGIRNAIADQGEKAAMTQRGDPQPEPGRRLLRWHQTLGQHLTDQTAAARAERGSHAELALARCAPRQQQIGHVDAGNQQYQQHSTNEREECRPKVADHLLLQSEEHHGPAGIALRLFFLQVGVDASHLAVGLLERNPVAQSPDGVRAAAAAHGAKLLQRLTVWSQEVGFLSDDGESGSHHPDDGSGCVICGESQRTEHVGAAAKASLPELVAQHDDGVTRESSSGV